MDKLYNFDLHTALCYENEYNKSTTDDKFQWHLENERISAWIKELEDNNIFSEKITLIYGVIMMKKIISKNNFFKTFDDNCGILPDDDMEYLKKTICTNKIEAVNSKLFGLINPKFNEHINFTKVKVFSIETFIDLGFVKSRRSMMDIFIQSLIQRVNKCRMKALMNNRYQNPFDKNNIINFTGLLISQRFVKNHFNLNIDMDNYINTLNSIDKDLIEKFVNMMIKKTITIKKYILENIDKVTEDTRKKIILEAIKI